MMNDNLKKLRREHSRRYDAVDGVHWGCICGPADCDLVVIVDALDGAERDAIQARSELLREQKEYYADLRKLSAEIAGLENYIEKFKREKQ